MIAAALYGCVVYDRDGELVGHVHDLVFDRRGEREFVLAGVECGAVGSPHRLGYGKGDMAGPWPLTSVFHALARRSLYVDWADVTRFDRPRIEIRRAKAELRSAEVRE